MTPPKKTDEEYKDMYFEEKFDRINEKLDAIADALLTKASATFVSMIDGKVDCLEKNKVDKTEFDPVKKATEGAVYYGKHPKQLKMVIIGALVLAIISLATIVPSLSMLKKYSTELKIVEKEQKK